MANTKHNAKIWALAGLFKLINIGENPKSLCSEARQIAKNVDPYDIAGAEQVLIDEGYPCRLVQQISSAFILMGLDKPEHNNSGSELMDDHIIQKIMVEHNLTRCYLADLKNISETIMSLDSLTDVSSEFRKLTNILEYFMAMKEHFEREEDVIFPYLMKFGWTGLCLTAQSEHAKIMKNIDSLFILITSFNEENVEDFKGFLNVIVPQFLQITLEHLSFEDSVLWPVSLIVIDDIKVWKLIKETCEELGYCNSHL